jgi:tRNA/rRNA methyltransferase
MKPEDISIILIETMGAMNVGSVCRTMMNFGLSDLRLVNPICDWRSLDARRMAMKADTLLDQARIFACLEDALADRQVAMGTTCRLGKYREDLLSPAEAVSRIADLPRGSQAAYVFGREDRGLTTDELELCQHFVTIPTVAAYPSMNLAQAVALCIYEIRKRWSPEKEDQVPQRELATGTELEQMYAHMQKTFLEIDYLDPQNPSHIMRALRRLFGRAHLDQREVRIIRGVLSRIDWTEAQRRKGLPD